MIVITLQKDIEQLEKSNQNDQGAIAVALQQSVKMLSTV